MTTLLSSEQQPDDFRKSVRQMKQQLRQQIGDVEALYGREKKRERGSESHEMKMYDKKLIHC